MRCKCEIFLQWWILDGNGFLRKCNGRCGASNTYMYVPWVGTKKFLSHFLSPALICSPLKIEYYKVKAKRFHVKHESYLIVLKGKTFTCIGSTFFWNTTNKKWKWHANMQLKTDNNMFNYFDTTISITEWHLCMGCFWTKIIVYSYRSFTYLYCRVKMVDFRRESQQLLVSNLFVFQTD